MARECSDKNPFQSKYGGGWISPGQYLAEIMCVRKAAFEKTKLEPKFWDRQPWRNQFLFQFKYAKDLLKTYSADTILRALESTEGARTYSLASKIVPPLLAKTQSELVINKGEAE